jgi:hypothetical protein
LVFQPEKSPARRVIEKSRLAGRFPVKRQGQQEKWRRIACAAVVRVVRQRGDLAEPSINAWSPLVRMPKAEIIRSRVYGSG